MVVYDRAAHQFLTLATLAVRWVMNGGGLCGQPSGVSRRCVNAFMCRQTNGSQETSGRVACRLAERLGGRHQEAFDRQGGGMLSLEGRAASDR